MRQDTSKVREVAIWPNRLLCGEGSLARLGQALDDLGCARVFVICGNSVASSGILDMARAHMGERCVGVFSDVKMHSPLPDLSALVAEIRRAGADGLVSIGGGSAIDAAKGACLLLASDGDIERYAINFGQSGMKRALLPRRAIAHVAIPTTSGSASEVMSTAGIRDPDSRKKMLFWDDLLIPDAVILDPCVATQANPKLTATSGMTAVARCVEAIYSVNRHPISTALALHGLRLLHRALPVAVTRPDDLDARSDCQYACAMSGVAAINAMVSLVHAVGHAVGGRYGLQHGVSHAILLPASMRLLLPAIGDEQKLVHAALGGDGERLEADEAGARAAAAMEALLARLPLATRLRDLDIPADDLSSIARHTETEYMMANLPRPVSTPEVEALLRAAW